MSAGTSVVRAGIGFGTALAITLSWTANKSLLWVIIHGILHLCGINDKGPGEREIMEAAENKALAML